MKKLKLKKTSATHEIYEDIYKDGFSFGENWKRLISMVDEKRIKLAKKSITDFTGLKSLKGLTFLDIGCGSGLFSLAAHRLGAKQVISVDIDDSSIACTKVLRKKYQVKESNWMIVQGSVLDKKFLASLPQADIVYSWGVLHHTGRMIDALKNAASLVKPKGLFYLAIYNDFNGVPFSSKSWKSIKRFYTKRGKLTRSLMEKGYACVIITGLVLHGMNPIKYIQEYQKNATRGMDFFIDIRDWLGGYPYEYASVDEITNFFKKRGFVLVNVKPTQREGCNEFLLKKIS